MQIGFIGAGKVGVSLGNYFTKKGRKVGGYYSLSPKSAKEAAEITNSTQYESLQQIISSCDMIYFTVPDDRIEEVWEEAKPFVSSKIIAHCSGVHSSKIFSGIESTGSTGYSIHPLCAISSKSTSVELLAQTLFTIEGDSQNISIIQEIFQEMGNPIRVISAENKIKYHAAASFASNHVTAVFFMAKKLFLECGFSEEEAEQQLYLLAKGNLENIRHQGCTNSLTGPIERGDFYTVEKHLKSLNFEMKSAYMENAKQLVELAEQKHPERSYEDMYRLLFMQKNSRTEMEVK